MKRLLFFGCAVAALGASARADEFILPFDASAYFTPAGGSAGAVTTLGLGTSLATFRPVYSGLPGNPSPNEEIYVGDYVQGTPIHIGEETSFSGTFWAFSADTTSPASRTAFMDLDNSLGFGGSIIQPLGNNRWELHMDDAASYEYDDNDSDVLLIIRLVPLPAVPEPGTAAFLAAGTVIAAAQRRRRRA
jgi:hypothetical protein